MIDQHHFFKVHFGAFFSIDPMHKELLAFLHLELLSCYINYCVHYGYVYRSVKFWKCKSTNIFQSTK